MCVVVDIQVDYEVTTEAGKRTPQQHLIECLDRARLTYFRHRGDPSVTIDAAFGGTKMVRNLYLRGWLATASLNTAHEKALVNSLKKDLPKKAYRLVTRQYGGIYLQTMVYHAVRQKDKVLDEFGDKISNSKKESVTVAQTTSLYRPQGEPLPQIIPLPPGALPNETLIKLLNDNDKRTLYDLANYKHALLAMTSEAPTLSWSNERLLASFASRAVEDIQSLPPLLDKKRPSPGDSDELVAILQPHQRVVDEFERELHVIQQCRVAGCSKRFNANRASWGSFTYCDKCQRFTVCPKHIAEDGPSQMMQDHERDCVDTPYTQLKRGAQRAEDMMDNLRQEYSTREVEGETEQDYKKRLKTMSKADLNREGHKLGAFKPSATPRTRKVALEHIHIHLNTQGESTKQLREAVVGKPSRPGMEPLPDSHFDYVDTFNYVDRFNGQFYQVYYPYQVGSASTVFQNDLQTCLLVNAHAYHIARLKLKKRDLPIKEFVREVSLAKLKSLQ